MRDRPRAPALSPNHANDTGEIGGIVISQAVPVGGAAGVGIALGVFALVAAPAAAQERRGVKLPPRR